MKLGGAQSPGTSLRRISFSHIPFSLPSLCLWQVLVMSSQKQSICPEMLFILREGFPSLCTSQWMNYTQSRDEITGHESKALQRDLSEQAQQR